MRASLLVAAALALCAPAGRAQAGDAPQGSEWSALDRRLDELGAALEHGGEPLLRAWVQGSWRTATSGAVEAPEGGRLSGFALDTARVELTHRRDGFEARIELELAPGPLAPAGVPEAGQGVVLDAYATWWFEPEISWSLGRFRRPFVRSAALPRDALLFLDRSALGEMLARRDEGVRFAGDLASLRWRGAIQNGDDGLESRLLYSLRMEVAPFLRDVPAREGALDAPEETALTIGLALAFDDGVPDGVQYALDLALARKPFSLALEAAWFESGPFALRNPLLAPIGLAQPVEDTRPWAATASVVLLDIHELALRWQRSDDAFDTSSLALALVRHLAGPSARWVAQWEHVFTEAPSGDFDLFGVGLLVSL